jgi:hypothetical protein
MDACQELNEDTKNSIEYINDGCNVVKPDDAEYEKNSLTKHRLSPKYRPVNQFHHRGWKYFDSSKMYIDDTVEPLKHVGLYRYYSRELKRATQEATMAINKKYSPKRMKFRAVVNGFVKHNPLVGNEYIIDGKYSDLSHPSNTFVERVRLIQPLQTGFIIKPAKNDMSEKVNIVVPVSGVSQRCASFLKMYEKEVLQTDELVRLIFVTFSNEDVNNINTQVQELMKDHPNADISIVKGEGNFSRARALDQGMLTLNDNDLAFLCDVDMEVDKSFFPRCRRNTMKGKMVYYPEVFKMYNPKFIGLIKKWDQKKKIARSKGHWGSYAFGMLCIYKADYMKIGRLNTNMMGWGGEDVDFFEKVLKSKIEILRAPDIGLVHHWHPKHCSKDSMTDSNYRQCFSSRAEALGDRRQLAYYIYLLAENRPDLKLSIL